MEFEIDFNRVPERWFDSFKHRRWTLKQSDTQLKFLSFLSNKYRYRH